MANMSVYTEKNDDRLDVGFMTGHIITLLVVNAATVDEEETDDKALREKIDDELKEIIELRGLSAPGELAWGAASPGDGQHAYFTYPGGSYDPGEMPLNNAGSLFIQAADFSWSFSIDGFDLSFAKVNSLIAKDKFFSTIFAADDKIDLTAADDVLNSYGGDDVILDTGGSNTFHGGSGNDEISTLTGFNEKSGHNRIYGDSGNDSIIGGDGADSIDGGTGRDTMVGGAGNDTYIVDNTRDTVKEWSLDGGKDTVYSSASYQLAIYCDTLILTGNGDLKAHGSVLADTIIGNSGRNVIDGWAGKDLLKGGAGADKFVFDDGDSGKDKSGADTILDFKANQRDIIDLSAIDAIVKTAKDEDFDFIGKSGFVHAGELRYVREAHDTWIYGETDGDGKADFAIHLEGDVDLKNSNFDL